MSHIINHTGENCDSRMKENEKSCEPSQQKAAGALWLIGLPGWKNRRNAGGNDVEAAAAEANVCKRACCPQT
jgi:hypothetical protein